MKNSLIFVSLAITVTLFSCSSKPDRRHLIEVFPLSPYTDSLKFDKDEDVGAERKNGIRTEYFIVDEDLEYTELSKDRLSNFIGDSLAHDLKKYSAVYFTFYKKGFSLNKDFKQTPDNMLTKYTKNKFAEFEYIKGKLFNFDFYKDGAYYEPASTNEAAN